MMDKIFPKIHEEGYKFITIAALITVVIYFISRFFRLYMFCFYNLGVIIFLGILKEFQLMMKII